MKICRPDGRVITLCEKGLELYHAHKWSIQTDRNKKPYLCRKVGSKHFKFHRVLLGEDRTEVQVDHINRDCLDNRVVNLRQATNSQNQMNKEKQKGQWTSKYKGVSYYKKTGKWRTRIIVDKKTVYLGHYCTEDDAALAYNKAAVIHHKEFACLNSVKES